MSRKDKQKDKQRTPAEGAETKRVTPVDIQQKEFRESFKGYNEREVDEFLDVVTEEVARLHAENKRLQEQLDFRQTLPLGGTAQEAEEILRRARAEADRIVAEARSAVPGRVQGGPGGDFDRAGGFDAAEAINRFLGREREFLQALASRIQSHIEAVRDDARSAKSALEAEAAGASGWSGSAESSGAPVSEPDLPVSGHADQDAHDAEEHTGHSFESAAGPATAWSGLPDEEEAARHVMGEANPPGAPPLTHPELRERDEDQAGPVAEGPPTRHWEGPVANGGSAPGGSIRVAGVPTTGGSRGAAGPEEETGQERSLRELFWGED